MRKLLTSVGVVVMTALALLVAPAAASASPVPARLANAVVPAYCQMPRQHLHNGVTQKKYLPKAGRLGSYFVKPLTTHLRASGSQLLVTYECGAGGVGWPEVLCLYDRNNRLLSALYLGAIDRQEHADVRHWRVVGHTVRMFWRSYEGAGYDFHDHYSTLRFRSGHLTFR